MCEICFLWNMVIIYLHTVGSTQSLVSIARSVYFKNILYHTAYKLLRMWMFVFCVLFFIYCVLCKPSSTIFRIQNNVNYSVFGVFNSHVSVFILWCLSLFLFLLVCFSLSISPSGRSHPLLLSFFLAACLSRSLPSRSLSFRPILSAALDYAKVLYNCQKDVNPVFEFNVDDII